MIHVAAVILILGPREGVDHRGAGAQWHEPDRLEAALDMQAQHLLVECDRAIHIRDPQYDMVEPLDPHGGRRGAANGCHIIRHSSAPCPISRVPIVTPPGRAVTATATARLVSAPAPRAPPAAHRRSE